ncbi:MAG: DUF1822 family protein [Cyanobacteriota bacterium]|nr:DUF1822 family protein [Cyanobacteriota bacterium]
MINSLNTTTSFRQIVPEILWLEPEDFDRAKATSDILGTEELQWQVYLTVLALLSFEGWITIKLENCQVKIEDSSIFNPRLVQFVDAACNVRVGDFKVCVIATENPTDEMVLIPKAAIDLPEFAAHFYVFLEVLEEEEEAIFRGILRRDRLDEYRQSSELSFTGNGYKSSDGNSDANSHNNNNLHDDWHYEIPLAWFDGEPNHLLFDCRYLDPQNIPLLAAAPTPTLSSAQLQQLLRVLSSNPPQLRSHLTWEQGSIVLQHPELLDVDMAKLPPESLRSLDTLLEYLHQPLLVQQSVRLSGWLQRSFEEGWQQVEAIFTPPELGMVRELSPERGMVEPQSTTPEAIASVIHLLQPDRPEATRCQAAGVLGEIGAGYPDATTALAELLQTAREEETRWQAALSLGKIEPQHPAAGVKRARTIDLGVQLNGYQVALVVAIAPKAEGKLGVWLEVKPMGQLTVLPPQLKLSILSETGEVRMEVEARSDDRDRGKDTTIAQRFNTRPGKRFQVRVSLGEVSVTEEFMA